MLSVCPGDWFSSPLVTAGLPVSPGYTETWLMRSEWNRVQLWVVLLTETGLSFTSAFPLPDS